jgi:hypothetical protein
MRTLLSDNFFNWDIFCLSNTKGYTDILKLYPQNFSTVQEYNCPACIGYSFIYEDTIITFTTIRAETIINFIVFDLITSNYTYNVTYTLGPFSPLAALSNDTSILSVGYTSIENYWEINFHSL